MHRSFAQILLAAIVPFLTGPVALVGQERPNEPREILIEARATYVEDGLGHKAHERALMYVHMREGIDYSPLLTIAIALTRLDDPEALATAELIEAPPYRAFALICVARELAARNRIGEARSAVEKAIALMRDEGFDPDDAKSLWPHVAGAILVIEGSMASAKTACEKAGCPWEAMETEEFQIQLARFHLMRGKVEAARNDLHALPQDTFKMRKGQQALLQDNGAWLYYWAAQPDSAYTAEDQLLDWLLESPSRTNLEELLPTLPDDDIRKVAGYLSLAELLHEEGNAAGRDSAFAQGLRIRDRLKEGEQRDAIEVDVFVARLAIEGKPTVRAIVESGLLEKYKHKPWIGVLVRPLLELGEVELARSLLASRPVDDHTRCSLAVALTKSGRLEEALAEAAQVTGLLDDAIALMGVAMQLHENGDDQGAKRIWLDALAKAEPVRATNKWFVDEGEVRLERKWQAMTTLLANGIRMGFVEEALERFDGECASVRALARALADSGRIDRLREWANAFDADHRAEGARSFALIGLAESLLARRK